MDPKALATEQVWPMITAMHWQFHNEIPQTAQAAQQHLTNATCHVESLKKLLAETQAQVVRLQDLVNNYDERYAKAHKENQKKVDAVKRLEYAVFIPTSSGSNRREMSNWCRKHTKTKKYGEWAVNAVVTNFRVHDPSRTSGYTWQDSMLGANASGNVYFFADKQTAMLFKLTFI